MNTSIRIAVAAAASIVVIGTAAACSDDSSSSDHASSSAMSMPSGSASIPASASFNAADVMFDQMMIPHHQQAVEMAKLVPSRTTNERVRALATAIEGAQQPEIDQMTAALQAWHQPTSMPSDGGHGGHGGHSMSGMMNDDQMNELKTLSGSAFDTMWLRMMVEHHQGAIEMAQTELAQGKDPATKALAQSIIDAQQKEIAQMRSMLPQ
ncbi:DUF305 domain-containing protein [Jongsikchunia kroppenstedtii]|uniref:DUF305 domain-containing protein n=1 Tax=Jongsikchunia kroppenstedtii TaxID=1121721 RepID=UPI000362807F|nr:DUF305 domain-containing protein [Jongsikchunia kroppenstedtii]